MPEGDSTRSAAGTPRKKYSRGEYMKPHSKPFDPNELSNTVIDLNQKYTDVTQDIAKTSQEYDQAVKICTPKKTKPAKSKDVISLQNRSITEKRINKACNPQKLVNIRYESEEALQMLLQEDDTDDDDDNDDTDDDDDEDDNPPPDNPGRKGGNGNNGNSGGQSGTFRSHPTQGIGSQKETSKLKNGGNGGGGDNLGTRHSDPGTTSQVTEAHQEQSVRFLVKSSNDVLTLHSIDDISNMARETQYTQKDVQLYQEDIITEDTTVHTHHLHEVASGESSQKIDSHQMEIPQESEHPDEQEFHIGEHFEVEENRSYLVDKQLEVDKTKMEDEQELHYYEMQIPHEEQFAVEQSKKDYNEEKLQHERVSLEGEEVHEHEDGSPPEKQFEVQQVRNDHEEQKSQEEKQLQVEQCESQRNRKKYSRNANL